MILLAITVFLSAFLLFLIQPLIARMILPWFGGTAAVWTTCLMFFQTVLLLGYIYAAWLVRKLRPRVQTALHISLLAASLATLPVLPNSRWKPAGAQAPALHILALLAVTVGVPYLVLSTTGPLLQAWYARLRGGAMPYRLYALSNAGSLLALISYPVLVEPALPSGAQAYLWTALYVCFAICCSAVAWRAGLSGGHEVEMQPVDARPQFAPALSERLLWVALAACPSALLLAITNHLSQNIAPIPLLWVAPLALYLISLVLCFESDRWYLRGLWFRIFLLVAAAMGFELYPQNENTSLKLLLPLFLGGLFCVCMVCHGELARRKPAPEYLTTFYLMLAIGGAIGGVFVALIAPAIFHTFLELPLGLLAACILITVLIYRDGGLRLRRQDLTPIGLAAAVIAGFLYLITVTLPQWLSRQRLVERNFYGELVVHDVVALGDLPEHRDLLHGTIRHGSQLLPPDLRRKPTTYYGPTSGVGRAIRYRQAQGPIRGGFIGLGAGTLAAYSRSGDAFTFYEINPLVDRIARTQFTFLADSPAPVSVLLGDARRTLEVSPPQNFDVLAVDAFSSDAIPVHLLTVEAFREYFRHLRPAGVLAVHISNKYLRLEWVVRLAAQALGKQALQVVDDGGEDAWTSNSDWVLVSGQPEAFEDPRWKGLGYVSERPAGLRAWTDDYSNLYTILK